jgi:dolichol kinase
MIFHVIYKIFGLFFPISYLFLSKKIELLLIGIFLLIFVFLEYLRRFKKVEKNLGFIFTKKRKISGTSYYLISAFFLVLFFSKEIVYFALLFTILGDIAAYIFGGLFSLKKTLNEKKSLAGFLGCLLVSLFAGFLSKFIVFRNFPIIVISIGALTVSIAEFLSTKIDDNLTMPIASAILMQILK